MLDIPVERMEAYVTTARQRVRFRQAAVQKRREQAWTLAHQASQLLKEFGAKKVVLFGSLLSDRFHETSDIDLAVWGLPERQYFQAVSRLLSLSEIEIDLVEVQYADALVKEAIEQGLEL